MTGETPRPVLHDVVRHGWAAGQTPPPPDPFPMSARGRHHSARYLFADGSYIEVRPTVGGIEVRCVAEAGHGQMVVRPHDASLMSILLPVEPWTGDGWLHLPGGIKDQMDGAKGPTKP